MAVTKIRKISSWTLLTVSVITLVVLALFYFGGIVDPAAEMKEPVYTDLLINWMYLLFAGTVVSAVVFALWQMGIMLKEDPKGAIMSVVTIALFAAMFIGTYAIGNGAPLQMIGYEGSHNVAFWLKLTDMWIYSMYILIALLILAAAWGSVKNVLNK
ncbi:MAG: hypothetical protein RR382_08855 [Tannerellaceae bacterium]